MTRISSTTTSPAKIASTKRSRGLRGRRPFPEVIGPRPGGAQRWLIRPGTAWGVAASVAHVTRGRAGPAGPGAGRQPDGWIVGRAGHAAGTHGRRAPRGRHVSPGSARHGGSVLWCSRLVLAEPACWPLVHAVPSHQI